MDPAPITRGLKSIQQKTDELEGRLQQMEAEKIPSNPTFTKLSQIATSSNARERQFQEVREMYGRGLPSGDLLGNVVKIVEYTVDFVEKNYPTLQRIFSVIAESKSVFKLETALSLIGEFMGPAAEFIDERILTPMINLIVGHQNQVKSIAAKAEPMSEEEMPPPSVNSKGTLKRRRLFGK